MAAGVTAAGWEKLLEMEVQRVFNARLSRVVDAERAEGGDGHDTLSALRLKRAMRSAPTPQRQLAVKMGSPPKKPHKGRGRDSEAQPMPGKWPEQKQHHKFGLHVVNRSEHADSWRFGITALADFSSVTESKIEL